MDREERGEKSFPCSSSCWLALAYYILNLSATMRIALSLPPLSRTKFLDHSLAFRRKLLAPDSLERNNKNSYNEREFLSRAMREGVVIIIFKSRASKSLSIHHSITDLHKNVFSRLSHSRVRLFFFVRSFVPMIF
jgi:hypothetical protein